MSLDQSNISITYSLGNTWGDTRETMLSIALRVAAAHRMSLKTLKGSARHRPVAHARFEAMWLMRQQKARDGGPRYSLPQIANFFGRDHTTALHAIRRYESGQTRRLAA